MLFAAYLFEVCGFSFLYREVFLTAEKGEFSNLINSHIWSRNTFGASFLEHISCLLGVNSLECCLLLLLKLWLCL